LSLIFGWDVGGTKTALLLGDRQGQIHRRVELTTPAREPFEVALPLLAAAGQRFLAECANSGLSPVEALSVSVGGPLDIEQGVLFAPPHLAAWGEAHLKAGLEQAFQLPVYVEHDGNAGALAEFHFGAGMGARNLVFLTVGTGLGAGIILNGQIYHGSTDMAGEVGHIRMAEDGPLEYGKAGSWEGFSSGSGLAQLAHLRDPRRWPAGVTTREVVGAALAGDASALAVVEESGRWLGRGMAILVDLLNPDVIVVGTLGVVLGDLLLAPARAMLQAEALPRAAQACRVVPAALGSRLGDVAALMAAITK
jgi:glucokinase